MYGMLLLESVGLLVFDIISIIFFIGYLFLVGSFFDCIFYFFFVNMNDNKGIVVFYFFYCMFSGVELSLELIKVGDGMVIMWGLGDGEWEGEDEYWLGFNFLFFVFYF